MKAPQGSLLTRAHFYMRGRAGRTALAVAPLASLGLAARPASAIQPATADFDPAAVITYGNNGYDSNYRLYNPGGSIAGHALSTPSNLVTGAAFDGSSIFTDYEGGFAGLVGSINMFSINGTGSGTFSPLSTSIPIFYEFTLASSGGTNDPVAITNWSLALTVATTGTGGGTSTMSVSGTGPGTFTDTVQLPIDGAASGATLSTYSAILTVNYSSDASTESGYGAMISATLPTGSIDFNAVPEPSTWLILGTGVAGTGLRLVRVRQRRAKTAPAA